ncbi:MAG TPA: cell wall hydrolase [Novosphingobium sp.]
MASLSDLPFEQRPSDFAARFSRRGARGIGARARRRHAGRRAGVLLAAVAVPAIAAPEQWPGAFTIGDAGASGAVQPMPFERAGDSFPGSAFYYLAPDDPRAPAPPLETGAHWDSEDAVGPGPAARSMFVDNSGVDRTRALQCMTAAIYYEAASESDSGQRAVAQVVLNRVAHPSYPKTVCGVVFQGSERRTGCQFSFTCDGSMARRPMSLFWQRAEAVARAALSGYVHTPVGLATHYHTIAVHPYWAPSLAFIGTIGAHRFYRFAGAAGQPGTFRFAYAGGEPVAVPHRPSAVPELGEDPALDPLAVQRAYASGLASAQTSAAASVPGAFRPATHAAPIYAAELQARGGEALYRGEKLPQGGAVRPEYAESGKWIGQPGT